MITSQLYHLSRPVLLSIALIYSSPGMSNIYKWVDEQGNVHYGQQRPADASAEKMRVNSHAPRDTSSYKRPSLDKKDKSEAAEGEGDDAEKSAENAAKEKKPMTPAEKKRNKAACEQARAQLSQMQSLGRVRSRDKDGNTTYMSQPQKEARMKKLREAIAKKCK